MHTPILPDTTLRDGEQSPGGYFAHSGKLQIAFRSDALGIATIAACIPSMGQYETESLQALQRIPFFNW